MAQPDEVLLEADLPAGWLAGLPVGLPVGFSVGLIPGPVRAGQGHHGGHPVLGHGQQRQLQPPGGCDLGRDGGQACALCQPTGPVEVRPEVPVAEAEPGLAAEALQGVHGLPGLAGQPPAGLGVAGLGQRVGDGVQVRRDVQAVQDYVVSRVHDRRDVRCGNGADHAPQESGGPHATGQDGDHALAPVTRPSRS